MERERGRGRSEATTPSLGTEPGVGNQVANEAAARRLLDGLVKDATALERRAAGLMMGGAAPTEPKSDLPMKTFKGTPFVKGEGDAHDIDPNDVHQGDLGDCWFLSGAAAVARANPEAIRRLIKDNHDGTYDVTLYVADHMWSARKPHVVRVDSRFPAHGGGVAYAYPGDIGARGTLELWVMLLEKAYAQFEGRYETRLILFGGMEGSNSEGQGIEALTGQGVSSHLCALTSAATIMAQMTEALAQHRPITAGSDKNMSATRLGRRVGIVDTHEYSVRATNPQAMTVSLQNPWGDGHLDDLPIADFKALFKSYAIGARL